MIKEKLLSFCNIFVLSFIIILISFVNSGCASKVGSSNKTANFSNEISDPIEPLNRFIFEFNNVVEVVVLTPVSSIYSSIFPDVIRNSVRNFLRNLEAPVTLTNDILQGEHLRARDTSMRFLINTTAGLLGLFDVADQLDYKYHHEDFGQTLAVQGVGQGPYIVLPLIGPSSMRHTVGRVTDIFLNPMTYVSEAEEINYALKGTKIIDGHSRIMDTLSDLKRDSLDYYSLIKSVYSQRRKSVILNENKNLEKKSK
ncbi:MAG: VacJ family lipoprotein [Nitrospinota bacterium]|nr:VacJ family lipoprotein [Nitrospinota bacterium]